VLVPSRSDLGQNAFDLVPSRSDPGQNAVVLVPSRSDPGQNAFVLGQSRSDPGRGASEEALRPSLIRKGGLLAGRPSRVPPERAFLLLPHPLAEDPPDLLD